MVWLGGGAFLCGLVEIFGLETHKTGLKSIAPAKGCSSTSLSLLHSGRNTRWASEIIGTRLACRSYSYILGAGLIWFF